ncbi:MAG: hypothetical protein MRY78_02485 [Saprospiraceae bacterium]|nr:hypothetical protein [Saprospiraceae bacterium]
MQSTRLFQLFFSDSFKQKFEHIIIYLSVGGFLIHLLLIGLHHADILTIRSGEDRLFENPLAAIYTPFSFILVFEVYLLIYFLPQSFTVSIGKQFEIISLIIVRRIFKDISKVEMGSNWFSSQYNVQFIADMIGFPILFFLIFLYNRYSAKSPKIKPNRDIQSFVQMKRMIAVVLVPVLLVVTFVSFGEWIWEVRQLNLNAIDEIRDINSIFYHEFFSILTITEVFILIISLRYTHDYSQLIRNSGFVVSTVVIRISFYAEGILNIALIILAAAFSVAVLVLYNWVASIKQQASAIDEQM